MLVLEDAFAQADPEVTSLLRAAIERMADDLPAPVPTHMPPGSYDLWREHFRIVQGREIWQHYGNFITRHRPRLGPGINERMEFAAQVTEREAQAARQEVIGARKVIRAVVQPGTVLALPTAPSIAPLADTAPPALHSFRLRVMRLTCIAGVGGLPQITIPVGSAAGCPVGLSFIGWAGGDETLLELAVRLARHCGLAG
jgi:amidase